MLDEHTFAPPPHQREARIGGPAVENTAHWTTPPPAPRRYHTRCCAARGAHAATPIVDPREMTDALWVTPSRALEGLDRGEIPMVFPTIKTVEQLTHFDTTEAALEGYAGSPVRTILPTLVVTPTGVGLQIDD